MIKEIEEFKTCKTCNEQKEISKFRINRSKTYKGTLVESISCHCKTCENKKREERRKTNNPDYYKQKAITKTENWKSNNPEKVKEHQFSYTIKRKYGLSRKEYIDLRESQDNKCKICGKEHIEDKGLNDKLHLDHCHITNKVRGFLCNNCNIGLGNFKDDPDLMLKAIEYLRESKQML